MGMKDGEYYEEKDGNIMEKKFWGDKETGIYFTTVHIYPVLIKQFFEKEKTISIDLLIQ